MSQVPIHWMTLEELLLLPPSIIHGYIRHDILLTPVDNAYESEFEGISPAGQDIQSIRPCIHQI